MRLFQKNRPPGTGAELATTTAPDEPVDWSNLDDRSLCNWLNRGTHDEQSRAFSVLYDRYEPKIRNYVLKQLNYVKSDGLEVIGDTWLVFWRERAVFIWRDDAQAENPLQSWLYGIARNRVKSKVRQNEKERASFSSVPIDLIGNFIETCLEIGSEHAENPEVRAVADRQFNRLMQSLSTSERQIVTLRYYKELSYAEIGQQLGKSSGAVRTAHTRLIQKLRQSMEQ